MNKRNLILLSLFMALLFGKYHTPPSHAQACDITVVSNSDNGIGTLRQAVLDAPDNSTICLGTDVMLNSGIVINKNLTINGQGNQITVANSDSIAILGVSVTLNNVVIYSNAFGAIYGVNATITVNNTTINSSDTSISGSNSTITTNNTTLIGLYDGIYAEYGSITVNNTTINAVYRGVSVDAVYIVNVNNSTISGSFNDYSGADVTIKNSIVSSFPYYCPSTNISNLVVDGSCSPAFSGDPMLGPLQDNGGVTFTMKPACSSPVVDVADMATSLSTDQRGIIRPQNGLYDIGAVELAPIDCVINTPTATGTPTDTPTATGTPTATDTPTATGTPTNTPTPTITPTPIPTSTPDALGNITTVCISGDAGATWGVAWSPLINYDLSNCNIPAGLPATVKITLFNYNKKYDSHFHVLLNIPTNAGWDIMNYEPYTLIYQEVVSSGFINVTLQGQEPYTYKVEASYSTVPTATPTTTPTPTNTPTATSTATPTITPTPLTLGTASTCLSGNIPTGIGLAFVKNLDLTTCGIPSGESALVTVILYNSANIYHITIDDTIQTPLGSWEYSNSGVGNGTYSENIDDGFVKEIRGDIYGGNTSYEVKVTLLPKPTPTPTLPASIVYECVGNSFIQPWGDVSGPRSLPTCVVPPGWSINITGDILYAGSLPTGVILLDTGNGQSQAWLYGGGAPNPEVTVNLGWTNNCCSDSRLVMNVNFRNLKVTLYPPPTATPTATANATQTPTPTKTPTPPISGGAFKLVLPLYYERLFDFFMAYPIYADSGIVAKVCVAQTGVGSGTNYAITTCGFTGTTTIQLASFGAGITGTMTLAEGAQSCTRNVAPLVESHCYVQVSDGQLDSYSLTNVEAFALIGVGREISNTTTTVITDNLVIGTFASTGRLFSYTKNEWLWMQISGSFLIFIINGFSLNSIIRVSLGK